MTSLSTDRLRLGAIAIATLVLPLAGCAGGDGKEQAPPTLSGTIAFTLGDRWTRNEVVLIRADGTGLRTVARGSMRFPESRLRWSPGDRMLVFAMDSGVGLSRLRAVRVDGKGLRWITGAKEENDINPAWSPDGRRLVFDSEGDGWTDLGLVKANGTGERKLAKGSYVRGNPARVAGGDAWSPDGRRIVYIDRQGRLAVMRPDGGDRRRLGGGLVASGDASWAPTGRKIVFTVGKEIAVVNADGTGRRTIAPRGRFPVWSPDGRRIAFAAGGVFVVNADGSGLRNVGSGDWPSWSPDGRWIVYASSRRGRSGIYVVRPDGSGEHRVIDTPRVEAGPVWSPLG